MRTVTMQVHNTQSLELFVRKRKIGFDLWQVGINKGRRILLDHYPTHDDLEARLEYSQSGDLEWRDAKLSDIPLERHRNAFKSENVSKEARFIDFDQAGQQLSYHFGGRINMFSIDRRACNLAKKAILGHWTDNLVSVFFEPDHKVSLSNQAPDRPHPLNIGPRAVAWWGFGRWTLHLLDKHKAGIRVGVLRVDDKELHVYSEARNRIAHILKRQ